MTSAFSVPNWEHRPSPQQYCYFSSSFSVFLSTVGIGRLPWSEASVKGAKDEQKEQTKAQKQANNNPNDTSANANAENPDAGRAKPNPASE